MAFIDFCLAPATGLAVAPVRLCGAKAEPEAILSALERQVLALARNDRMCSLRSLGTIDRIAEALFGTKRPNLLADPRLEAVRRLAVIARHGGARRIAREMPSFLATGYEPRHATAVLSLATVS